MGLKGKVLTVFGMMIAIALSTAAAHVYVVQWTVSQPTTIGSMEMKAGQYEIRVEEGQSQLQVMSHGKMVAEVPCHWMQLREKAKASSVAVDSNKVAAIQFSGKTAAVDFQ